MEQTQGTRRGKALCSKCSYRKLPFLLTSCCPSWSMLGKKYFPEVIDEISNALTPMVATARAARITSPNAKIVL